MWGTKSGHRWGHWEIGNGGEGTMFCLFVEVEVMNVGKGLATEGRGRLWGQTAVRLGIGGSYLLLEFSSVLRNGLECLRLKNWGKFGAVGALIFPVFLSVSSFQTLAWSLTGILSPPMEECCAYFLRASLKEWLKCQLFPSSVFLWDSANGNCGLSCWASPLWTSIHFPMPPYHY